MKTDLYTKVLLTVIAFCLTFNVLKDIKLIPNVWADSLQVQKDFVNLPTANNLIKTNLDGSINVRLTEVVKVEPNYGAEFKVKQASSYDYFTVKPASNTEFIVKPPYNTAFEVKPAYNTVFDVKPAKNTVFTVKQQSGSTYSESIKNEENTVVYTNHQTKQITISYNTAEKNEYLAICDLNGRMMDYILLDPANNQLTVDVARYNTGIYIYAHGRNSGKFILK